MDLPVRRLPAGPNNAHGRAPARTGAGAGRTAGRDAFSRWLDRSIANRITLTAASITAVVVVALGCVAYTYARAALLEQAGARLHAQSQLVAQRMALTLQAAARDLESLAGSALVGNALLDRSGRDAYLLPLLRDHRPPLDVAFRLSLIDHRGEPLASSRAGRPPSYAGAPWLGALLIEAQPQVDVADETMVIAMPVMLPASDAANGALVLELDLGDLFASAAAHAPQVSRQLLLQGAPILHLDAAGSRVVPPPVLAAHDGALPPSREPLALTGALAGARLAVLLKRDGDADAALLAGLASTLALLGGGVLLLVAWAAHAAARRLTAPLTQLSQTAEAIRRDGRLDHRVPALGEDEIGVLADALGQMLERLRGAHQGLEAQVAARTAELAHARERLATIVDQMHDGLVMLDADGLIESMNRAAETLFETSGGDVAGLHMSRLISGWFRATRALATPAPARFELNELVARRGAAGVFIADCAVARIDDGGRTGWAVLVRDVTARRRAEAALREANERLSASVTALQRRDTQMAQINRMNEMLQSCQSMDEAYDVVERTLSALFPRGGGALAVAGPSGDQLAIVARWGKVVSTPQFSAADCWALRLGRAHTLEAGAPTPCCPHHAPAMRAPAICLPLMVAGHAIGVITASFDHADSDSSVPVLQVAAEAVRAALANLRLRDALREQALRDRLTGLYNRRYLDDVVPRELLRAHRSGQPLTVAMIDLDHFKRLNDEHGHLAGDHVLREIAGVLRAQLRASDIVCRYGGEELMVLMPDTPLAEARERLDAIRQQVAALRLTVSGAPLPRVTVSVGVTEASPGEATDALSLIRAADRALYAAKAAGRNTIAVAAAAITADAD